MAQIIWENFLSCDFLTTGKSECLSGMRYVQLRWWSCLEVAFYLQVLWFCYYQLVFVLLWPPLQQNPPFGDTGIGNSPLPYMCKSVGSPGEGRHGTEISNCANDATEPAGAVGVCVLPTWPPCWRHRSLLAQEWPSIYPKCCRGTWRSLHYRRLGSLGPVNSFLLPKARGYHQGKARLMQTPSALRHCPSPPRPRSPSHFQVCLSNRLIFHWMWRFSFKTGGKKHCSHLHLAGTSFPHTTHFPRLLGFTSSFQNTENNPQKPLKSDTNGLFILGWAVRLRITDAAGSGCLWYTFAGEWKNKENLTGYVNLILHLPPCTL